LARALSSQRAFTDAAAHELRTPLTVIDTHLQVARISEGDEVASSLSSAEEGVKRLRRTLDQMMTLARAETPADEADGCTSVAASARSVLDQWREAEDGERLSLNIDGEDIGTPVPKSILETAVRNLVDNAMRYSPKDTAIEVEVLLDEGAQRCLITVSDRGPGLTTEQASQIGQRFWRGDQGRQSKDGAGLGISIVRAIAERFGGTLELKPREGGGLVAGISLPGSKC
jgi:two-component system sensor histidine kinase QseC